MSRQISLYVNYK